MHTISAVRHKAFFNSFMSSYVNTGILKKRVISLIILSLIAGTIFLNAAAYVESSSLAAVAAVFGTLPVLILMRCLLDPCADRRS